MNLNNRIIKLEHEHERQPSESRIEAMTDAELIALIRRDNPAVATMTDTELREYVVRKYQTILITGMDLDEL
jgi:hypothetical protein